MQNLSDTNVHERLELLMARRTATKALKIITTNKVNTWSDYELHGDL